MLWYRPKNNALDSGEEFGEWEKRDDLGNIIRDSEGNPKEPRNYFPVTNAGTLARVLDKAFEMAVSRPVHLPPPRPTPAMLKRRIEFIRPSSALVIGLDN